MRAEERLKAEGRLVDGEAAPGDILAQVCSLFRSGAMSKQVWIFMQTHPCIPLTNALPFLF